MKKSAQQSRLVEKEKYPRGSTYDEQGSQRVCSGEGKFDSDRRLVDTKERRDRAARSASQTWRFICSYKQVSKQALLAMVVK